MDMFYSDDYDLMSSTDSLVVQDIFQKEIPENNCLPYAAELNDEARRFLVAIKDNLGRAIIARELRPGCYTWITRLQWYIDLYGLKFTKEDHIMFIKLVYELLQIPNVDMDLMQEFITLMLMLLRKKYLISPKEMTLPWRPLYDLLKRMSKSKDIDMGMYQMFPYVEHQMSSLIMSVKRYFPIEATQEILDEFRPKIFPVDMRSMDCTVQCFEWFLPMELPPEHHDLGFKLWFQEFMELWDVLHNMPHWENNFVWLIANLANHNIGYIDWEPYLPTMFTKIMACFKLPVLYKKMQNIRTSKISSAPMALWIVSAMGNGSCVLKYLDKLAKVIETYVHPANYGSWTYKMKQFLSRLSYYLIVRLNKERYRKPSWETPIPDSHKLTDQEVDEFVKILMPLTMIAMFTKTGDDEIFYTIQRLALIRPSIVIPQVLEHMYSTLDSLTEPHKLLAVMSCMRAIARPLVQGSRNVHTGYTYPEGPGQVLPILFSCLPGIDPNDTRKCFTTLRLIAVYVSLIPIVDTSKSQVYKDDIDLEISEATSRFEDFILQLLDRVFILIESSSLEFVRLENRVGTGKSSSENMIESLMNIVFTTILGQTSNAIFDSALFKLRSFVTERIFETKVAGQLAAVLCRSFAKVNGHMTLKSLLPVLTEEILMKIEDHDEIKKEENLDERLSFCMLLLSEMVDTPGSNLMPYMDTLVELLDKILYFNARDGLTMANRLLKVTLHSLTNITLLHDTDIFIHDYNDAEYPHVHDWGQGIDFSSMNVKWFVPGKEEFDKAKMIFFRYFTPEIEKLQKFSETGNSLTRDELRNSLKIVNNVIKGCSSILPDWKEKPLLMTESISPALFWKTTVGIDEEITMPDGSNIRKFTVQVMSDLQKTMLKCAEDDTKSFFHLTQVWSRLLLGSLKFKELNQIRRRTFNLNKRLLEDKLVASKKNIGPVLLERIDMQHATRKVTLPKLMTETHGKILTELFTLATSRYSNVRKDSQRVFSLAFGMLDNSMDFILPSVLETMDKDPEQYHETFKGGFYILLDMMLRNKDWAMLSKLTLALLRSKPSEKLSVIRLKKCMVQSLGKMSLRFALVPNVTDECVKLAKHLWDNNPDSNVPLPSKDEMEKALQTMKELGQKNIETYNGFMDELVKLLVENNLQWRHKLIAMTIITKIAHPDQNYSAAVVHYFLDALISDQLNERKLGIRGVVLMLKQQKRKHVKIEIDRTKYGNSNSWLQYNSKNLPLTQEQWDEPRFVHGNTIGYYSWPKIVKVHAPYSQQPSVDANRELNDCEKAVDEFFSDCQNVEKLMDYFSLEEKAGRDKFNSYRMDLFEGLFRNHGDKYLKNFMPRLRKLVADKHESNQRCAAEFMAGLIRGSKHWPFDMVVAMWEELLPLVRIILTKITAETVMDWVICFATACSHRDPNRLHWLLECLMEEVPLGEAEVSFLECSRLLILQNAVAQTSWRSNEVFQRLLQYVGNRILDNPFQNLRNQMGSLMVTIFSSFLVIKTETWDPEVVKALPLAQDVLDQVTPQIKLLVEEMTAKGNVENTLSSQVANVDLNDTEGSNKSKLQLRIRMFKTICEWIRHCCARSMLGPLPGFYDLYPAICQLKNSEADDELSETSSTTLSLLAQAVMLPGHMAKILQTIEESMSNTSWSIRANSLAFLQVFIFHNMGTFLSNDKYVNDVQEIVLRSLEDDVLEVREKAAEVLGGLLHGTFIKDQEQLLEVFKEKSKTRLKKRKRTHAKSLKDVSNADSEINAIRLRHAGVLGLCAFIRAHPYDVPKYVPQIFQHLDHHFNDPQPIPATIRTTLADFKRTHYDSWESHAQQFTEEQLTVLQDLAVPPPHYT